MLVLDGYNVMFQFFRGGVRETPLESQRAEFLERLVQYCTVAGKNAIVVFDAERDGDARPVKKQIRRRTLSVVFTAKHQTADDLIIEFFSEHPDPRSLKVITSDRVILKEAERLRVPNQSSERFIDEMERALEAGTSAYDLQKQNGISGAEAEYWMREMGVSEKDLTDLLDE